MKKTDYELLNELYDQNISEAIPAVVGAVGKAAGAALAHKAGEGIADTMSSATGDPREVVTADVDSEFNDTSNELGDKLKSANVEMFSDMIAKAIEELINSTTTDNSPLGKKDCVDMIMASAQAHLESSCNRH